MDEVRRTNRRKRLGLLGVCVCVCEREREREREREKSVTSRLKVIGSKSDETTITARLSLSNGIAKRFPEQSTKLARSDPLRIDPVVMLSKHRLYLYIYYNNTSDRTNMDDDDDHTLNRNMKPVVHFVYVQHGPTI